MNAKNSILIGDLGNVANDPNPGALTNTIINDNDTGGHIITNPRYGFDTTQFTDYAGGDYTLISSSVAINNGSNANWNENSNNITTDLAGNSRIYNDAYDVIDLGAFELQGSMQASFVCEIVETGQNSKQFRKLWMHWMKWKQLMVVEQIKLSKFMLVLTLELATVVWFAKC